MKVATVWLFLESILLSKISQTEKDTLYHHLNVESEKITQMNVYNKTETDRQIQKLSGYQWGDGREKEKDRGMGLSV